MTLDLHIRALGLTVARRSLVRQITWLQRCGPTQRVELMALPVTYGVVESWHMPFLTAEPPYADDTNPWLRSHGLLVPHARIFQGADPTPYSFIRACMVMGPQGRVLLSPLLGLLWR